MSFAITCANYTGASWFLAGVVVGMFLGAAMGLFMTRRT